MARNSKEFVIRPEDTAGRVLAMAVMLVREMLASGLRVSVVISKWAPPKTPPQHRTVFMWMGEAAAQLTAMGALVGTGVVWTKDDVYESIFKPLCMPVVERPLPDGEKVGRVTGLSDPEATMEAVAEAMTKFQAWADEHGIELTEPDPDHVRAR